VIDWSRYYGLPGLIDVHTHMTYIGDRPGGVRGGGQRMAAVTVFLAQENARKTLETGVTAVRDLGASEYTDIAMRELINRGAMPGPRSNEQLPPGEHAARARSGHGQHAR
jgi:imidazolonepropionase-like amidohydrolase